MSTIKSMEAALDELVSKGNFDPSWKEIAHKSFPGMSLTDLEEPVIKKLPLLKQRWERINGSSQAVLLSEGYYVLGIDWQLNGELRRYTPRQLREIGDEYDFTKVLISSCTAGRGHDSKAYGIMINSSIDDPFVMSYIEHQAMVLRGKQRRVGFAMINAIRKNSVSAEDLQGILDKTPMVSLWYSIQEALKENISDDEDVESIVKKLMISHGDKNVADSAD